jgi:formate dehydrogenase subunit gamma
LNVREAGSTLIRISDRDEMQSEYEDLIRSIVDAHRGVDGATLPILHEVQAALGHIPDSVLPLIADALNISRAEMYGIVTFYHDFRRAPAGRHVVKLCRAEACQAMGGPAIADRLRARLAVDFGETSPDGRVSLEAVYCLGLCATAPSAMVDGRLVGRLDNDAADAIAAEVER